MTIKDLYLQYSEKYPYAVDAIAYFIFGDKGDDNIVVKALNGVYGRSTQIEYYDLSQFMLEREYSWEENLPEIDDYVRNIPTAGGEPLQTCY